MNPEPGQNDLPVLYSFRRCPYAMRARLAVASSGLAVELREIVLRDKAPAFLAASPTATVPTLVERDGQVIDESLDIMVKALQQRDPENWLAPEHDAMFALIEACDGSFKDNLDRYKYPNRYDGCDPQAAREDGALFLRSLDSRLAGHRYLFGAHPCLADMAILPFVRQFAHVDRDWFYAQTWPNLRDWLDRFLASDRFAAIMTKYPQWHEGDARTVFSRAGQSN